MTLTLTEWFYFWNSFLSRSIITSPPSPRDGPAAVDRFRFLPHLLQVVRVRTGNRLLLLLVLYFSFINRLACRSARGDGLFYTVQHLTGYSSHPQCEAVLSVRGRKRTHPDVWVRNSLETRGQLVFLWHFQTWGYFRWQVLWKIRFLRLHSGWRRCRTATTTAHVFHKLCCVATCWSVYTWLLFYDNMWNTGWT